MILYFFSPLYNTNKNPYMSLKKLLYQQIFTKKQLKIPTTIILKNHTIFSDLYKKTLTKNPVDIIRIEWQHRFIPFGDVVKLADTLDLESSSERSESSSLSVPTIENPFLILIQENLIYSHFVLALYSLSLYGIICFS